MKSYCTQNNGDCTACSLVNYGRDCRNEKIEKCVDCGGGDADYSAFLCPGCLLKNQAIEAALPGDSEAEKAAFAAMFTEES